MNYDEMVNDLMNQQKETEARATEGKFKGILKRDLPPGVERRGKIVEGEHLVDVVPYLCGDFHPAAKDHPPKPAGSPAFVLLLDVHPKIGPNEADFVCMFSVWGGKYRCPICEWRLAEQKKSTFNKDVVDSVREKQFTLMNTWWHETPELEAKGNVLWYFSYFSFLKPVSAQATIPFGGGFIPWFAPDMRGKAVYFKREGSGQFGTKYVGHKLMDRRVPIPEHILKAAHPLDTLIHWPTYEEVYEEFNLVPPESGSNTTFSLPSTTGSSYPSQSTSQNTPQQSVPAGGFYDMSQMSQTQSPAEPQAPKCPSGGIFGKDCELLPGGLCNGCKIWDACSKLSEQNKPAQVVTQPVVQPVQPESLPPDPPKSEPVVQATTPTADPPKPATTIVRRRR